MGAALAAGAVVAGAVAGGVAVVDAPGAEERQLLARLAALLEPPSRLPECVAIRIAIPAPRTNTMSPAVPARRARDRPSNLR